MYELTSYGEKAALEQVNANFVVAVSVADIRRDPDPNSELVTQALLNVPVRAGEVSDDWTYVTLVDYTGWIRVDELEEPIVRGICEGSEGICGVSLPYSAVVTVPYAPVYSNETGDSVMGEVYLSTVLPFVDLARAARLRVALPGNIEGWLPREALAIRPQTQLFPRQDARVVTAHALSFLGRPYLWGGTSWRGLDCSGFVQLCQRMGGTVIPRDANQQYAALPVSVPCEQMQEGDLIFFGRQSITHVGLALTKYEYIHAEGQHFDRVIIYSLDPAHPAYNGYLADLVWGIKRVRTDSIS